MSLKRLGIESVLTAQRSAKANRLVANVHSAAAQEGFHLYPCWTTTQCSSSRGVTDPIDRDGNLIDTILSPPRDMKVAALRFWHRRGRKIVLQDHLAQKCTDRISPALRGECRRCILMFATRRAGSVGL